MTASVTNAGKQRLMAQVERWLGARFLAFVILGVLGMAALIAEPFLLPRLADSIDWLNVTIAPVVLAGFGMAMSIPWRSERALAQLADRRVLQLSGEKLDSAQRTLRMHAARSAQRGSVVGGAAILLPIALIITSVMPRLLGYVHANDALNVAITIGALLFLTPFDLLVGLFAGYYMGYCISVGTWPALLRAQGATLHARPGHPDGAAGWGPLGDLYFLQALVLAVAALFFGVWSYLIAAKITDAYKRDYFLQTPYFVFCLIILAAEVLAFLIPVWSFHQDMRRQKLALASETDALSDRLLTMQLRAVETQDPEEASRLSQQLATMTSLYNARVNMPTWPFNTSVTARFVLANLALLLPLIAQLAQFHFQL